MAINIFNQENDNSTQSFDVVGRFRSGHVIGKRPQALKELRVTSDDPSVTDAVALLFGGTSQTWDNDKQPYEVFTNASSVDIIVERIFSGMTLWGRNGVISKCDGVIVTYPEDKVGEACACADKTMDQRKEAAKNGTGCAPDVAIRFRLQADPDLGIFEFRTSSWGMAKDIGAVERDLIKFGGRAIGTLALEPVEFTQKSTGELRKYTKSVVALTAAAPALEMAAAA